MEPATDKSVVTRRKNKTTTLRGIKPYQAFRVLPFIFARDRKKTGLFWHRFFQASATPGSGTAFKKQLKLLYLELRIQHLFNVIQGCALRKKLYTKEDVSFSLQLYGLSKKFH